MHLDRGRDGFMSKTRPDWSKLKKNLRESERTIERYCKNESHWVVIPREPANFGHLLVISWKGYDENEQDITDEGLFEDNNHMQEIMEVIREVTQVMKKSLTDLKGRECKRVYVVSECETKRFPFHFHLIPRFEGDKEGHMFLFEKEIEEARWMVEKDRKEDKIRDGCCRIGTMEGILNYHKYLIWSNEWVKSKEEREKFIEEIKAKIKEISMKDVST